MANPDIIEKAFREAVNQKRKSGFSFILAVYQALDEFLAREIENSNVVLACKKGCSFCCYQLVCCTEMGIDEMVRFVRKMPKARRRSLQKRLKNFAKRWQEYYQKNRVALIANPYRPILDWERKPCPFLNERGGFCDVYPVRIIDCRTASSLVPCNKGGKGERFRFPCENWANSMILEEQQKMEGMMGVTPIHHWLLVKRFFPKGPR